MLKAVDFFCGAGGVTNGFKQAKIKVLAGIDIDPSCKDTYEKNNKTMFINVDISKYPKEELSKTLGIKKNQDDLIFIGCSPCQYYSNITTNKNKSEGTRYLLADFQEFVDYYKPGHIFIENVPGIEKKEGSPLLKFKDYLKDNGYSFDEARVNTKHFGIPQNRLRYVLIASRVKTNIKIEIPTIKSFETVRNAIGNKSKFPPISASVTDTTPLQHSSARLNDLNITRLKHTPKNGGDKRDWPYHLLPPSSQQYKGHYDVYGRMFWDKPSPTITTKFRSLSNGRFGHPEQNRAITLREGAILQSFPMDYVFYHNSHVRISRMIGNAVPPKLAKCIGKLFK